MTIWIDADSFPSRARNYVSVFCLKNNITLIFCANKNIPFCSESPLFKMVICESGADKADDYIVEHACGDDLVLTRDLPFAKRLVDRNIPVINDRGVRFNKTNIDEYLLQRQMSLNFQALGVAPKGKFNNYGDKEFNSFVQCFLENQKQ